MFLKNNKFQKNHSNHSGVLFSRTLTEEHSHRFSYINDLGEKKTAKAKG